MHGVGFEVELPAIRHRAASAAVDALCTVLIKGEIFALGVSGQLSANWSCCDCVGRSPSGIGSSYGYGVAFGDVRRHAERGSGGRRQYVGTASRDGAKIPPTVEKKFLFLAGEALHVALRRGAIYFDDVLSIRRIRYGRKYADDSHRNHQLDQGKPLRGVASNVSCAGLLVHFLSTLVSNICHKETSAMNYMADQQPSQESGDKRSKYRNERMDNAAMRVPRGMAENAAVGGS
jgi:hypothetical protein